MALKSLSTRALRLELARRESGAGKLAKKHAKLAKQLKVYLRETRDPRVIDGGEIWEAYPSYSDVRSFPPPKASLP